MKKSDIFISIFLLRSEKPKSEREIREDLRFTLTHLSIELNQWDETVDPAIATQIITKIGSTKGELSMESVIKDVDSLLKHRL